MKFNGRHTNLNQTSENWITSLKIAFCQSVPIALKEDYVAVREDQQELRLQANREVLT